MPALAAKPVLHDPVALTKATTPRVDGLVLGTARLASDEVDTRRGTRPIRRPSATDPSGRPRRYRVWSSPSTQTVLWAAVPLNQRRRSALGIGEATRVDDERPTVGGDLDAEQVVVAVTAGAERAAVEDEEALMRGCRPSRCAGKK